MNNHQIILRIMRACKDRSARWLAIDLVFGYLDGFINRHEAEQELTGLVDDPAALLDEIEPQGEVL